MEKQLAEAAYHTERKNNVIAVGTTPFLEFNGKDTELNKRFKDEDC